MPDAPDLDLLRVVSRLRSEKGACTVRDVATQLGMSVPGTQHRIDRALEIGHLERSDVAGSLRVGVAAGNLWDMTPPFSEPGWKLEAIVTDDLEILDLRFGGR